MLKRLTHSFYHPTRRSVLWHTFFQALWIALVLPAGAIGIVWLRFVLAFLTAQLLTIVISSFVTRTTWLHDMWTAVTFYKRDQEPVSYWIAMFFHILLVVLVGIFLGLSFSVDRLS